MHDADDAQAPDGHDRGQRRRDAAGLIFKDETLPELSAHKLNEIIRRFPYSEPLLAIDTDIAGYYEGLVVDGGTFDVDRSACFLRHLHRYVNELLPESVAVAVDAQLRRAPIVSTAEHVASITNPQTLNVVLNHSLYQQANRRSVLISLAMGAMKLGNVLLSRDLFVGDQRVRLLPRKYDAVMILEAPPLDDDYVRANIVSALRADDRVRGMTDTVLAWWDETYREIAGLDSLWKQLARLNHRYWRDLVATNWPELPDAYVMLPVELVVRDAMIEEIESGRDDWLYELMFDQRQAKNVLDVFDGIRSCWDAGTGAGTFLFWTLNAKKKPRPMIYKDGVLRSEGLVSTLRLERAELAHALREGRVFPSTFLALLYLGPYLGLQLFSGILQAQYYPEILRRMTDGNQLGLPEQEVRRIARLRADLYLNFEKRRLSAGGVLKLFCRDDASVFEDYLARPFRREIMGCIGYLGELAARTTDGSA